MIRLSNFLNHRLPLLLSVLLVSGMAMAQDCKPAITKSTPDSRYVISGDGSEAYDTVTGLIWSRCSFGETWDGQGCAGEAKVVTWDQAKEQARLLGNGYRMPSAAELMSLTDKACSYPSVNPRIFPQTPKSNVIFWSTDRSRNPPFQAKGVHLNSASLARIYLADYGFYLLPVRSVNAE